MKSPRQSRVKDKHAMAGCTGWQAGRPTGRQAASRQPSAVMTPTGPAPPIPCSRRHCRNLYTRSGCGIGSTGGLALVWHQVCMQRGSEHGNWDCMATVQAQLTRNRSTRGPYCFLVASLRHACFSSAADWTSSIVTSALSERMDGGVSSATVPTVVDCVPIYLQRVLTGFRHVSTHRLHHPHRRPRRPHGPPSPNPLVEASWRS